MCARSSRGGIAKIQVGPIAPWAITAWSRREARWITARGAAEMIVNLAASWAEVPSPNGCSARQPSPERRPAGSASATGCGRTPAVVGHPGQGDGGKPERGPEGGRLAKRHRPLPRAADYQPRGQLARPASARYRPGRRTAAQAPPGAAGAALILEHDVPSGRGGRTARGPALPAAPAWLAGAAAANAAGDAACSSPSSGMPSPWPPSRSAVGHLLLTLRATARARIGVPP